MWSYRNISKFEGTFITLKPDSVFFWYDARDSQSMYAVGMTCNSHPDFEPIENVDNS